MKHRVLLASALAVVLGFSAQEAWAKTYKANLSELIYAPYGVLQQASVRDDEEARVGYGSNVKGAMAINKGLFFQFAIGDLIEVTYTDGSSETFIISCNRGTSCAKPVPGTQKAAPPPSTGGGEPGFSGGGRPGGGAPGGGSGSGTVTVGPIKPPFQEQAS